MKRLKKLLRESPTAAPRKMYLCILGLCGLIMLIGFFLKPTASKPENATCEPIETQNMQGDTEAPSEERNFDTQGKTQNRREKISDFCANLGVGILGSLICSWMIDIGTTQHLKRKEEREINVLKETIKTRWTQMEGLMKQAYPWIEGPENRIGELYAYKDGTNDGISKDAQDYFRGETQKALDREEESCTRLEDYLQSSQTTDGDEEILLIKGFREAAIAFQTKANLRAAGCEVDATEFKEQYSIMNEAINALTTKRTRLK